MYKTHKIALDPNNKQRRWFAQQCGYARFAYNHALADFKSELDKDNFLSASKLNNTQLTGFVVRGPRASQC